MEPLEVNISEIEDLLRKFPTLTANGLYPEGHRDLEKQRPEEMLTLEVVHQINYTILFLSSFSPIKVPAFSSYAIKHRAEKLGRITGKSSRVGYIYNGSAIAAGLLLDLPFADRGLNVDFGISKLDADWARHAGVKEHKGQQIRRPVNWQRFLDNKHLFI